MAYYQVRFCLPEEELLIEASSKLEAAEKVINLYPAAKILQAEPQLNFCDMVQKVKGVRNGCEKE